MNSTSEQKPTRRSQRRRKAINSQKKFSIHSLSFLFVWPATLAKKVFEYCLSRPKIVVYVASPLLLLGLVLGLGSMLRSYHEQILPTSVDVSVANEKLRSEIKKRALAEIKVAEGRRPISRTSFLLNLSKELENIDAIDEFWIRLGFDKKLQITATQQIPVLMLETGAGDRYLVGHKLRIIDKNPPENAFQKILRVTVPEIRLKNERNVSRTAKNNRFARNISNSRFVAENINLPWLFREAQLLQSHLAQTELRYGIEKVVWKSQNGFSLLIKGVETRGPSLQSSESSQRIHVTLGEQDLGKKVEKLAEVMLDLRSRKISPESIDLNYADKAIIKMSESNATQKPL